MKKILNNLPIIATLLFTITKILTKELNNLDELWNFSNALNISNNLIPYKQFNMITPPLYAIINSIPLKIFGKQLIVFRITYILLFILLAYLLSKIINKLNSSNLKKQIYISFIIFILTIITYSDYNFFNLLLLILILSLEINNNQSKNNNFLIGILLGLSILTKQTTGLIITTSSLTLLLINKFIYKEPIKKQLKYRIIGFLIILSLFLIYLLKYNIINDFIDLTILGLRGFKSRTNYKPIIFITIAIIYILFIIAKEYKHHDRINTILIIYSLFYLILNYPVIDILHTTISIIPCTILLIYNIPKIDINKSISKGIFLGLIIGTLFPTIDTFNQKNKMEQITEYKIYKYAYINKYNKQHLINVVNKIQKEKAYILDASAIFYMLPTNEYHHYFDIPLAGNVGTKGEQIMIKELQKNNKTILIRNEEDLKKSFPKLYQYILENYKRTETTESFKIYKKL